MVNIMLLDMAIANVGVVVMGCDSSGIWHHVYSELISTEKSDKKTNVRASEDNIRRAVDIYSAINRISTTYSVIGVAAEVPTGSQNARAAELLGMAKGLLAAFSAVNDKMIVEWVSPADVKLATGNTKTASKRAIINTVNGLWPEALAPFKKKDGTILNKAEHVADACGVFLAVKRGILCTTATTLARMSP